MFPAARKLARQDSHKTYAISSSKDRDIGVNITAKGRVNLIRYFTPEEMESKYQKARREGKKNVFIPPYQSQNIPAVACDLLYDNLESLQDLLMRVLSGEDLDPTESMITLQEDAKLYINIDSTSNTVHFRRFWRNDKHELCPTSKGVAISADEAMSFCMLYQEEIYGYLEELKEGLVRSTSEQQPAAGGAAITNQSPAVGWHQPATQHPASSAVHRK